MKITQSYTDITQGSGINSEYRMCVGPFNNQNDINKVGKIGFRVHSAFVGWILSCFGKSVAMHDDSTGKTIWVNKGSLDAWIAIHSGKPASAFASYEQAINTICTLFIENEKKIKAEQGRAKEEEENLQREHSIFEAAKASIGPISLDMVFESPKPAAAVAVPVVKSEPQPEADKPKASVDVEQPTLSIPVVLNTKEHATLKEMGIQLIESPKAAPTGATQPAVAHQDIVLKAGWRADTILTKDGMKVITLYNEKGLYAGIMHHQVNSSKSASVNRTI
jgi:hypothetical protein